ncbi:DUF433 domain-containing protein [Stakelama tenebrarum]|uniref:DUF433 domain-containing protein n=1 Tax=Stakelama tenebrarum TaxID=2711215 RepID=A0A6G6Y1L6_9SPHN|nr:DUF433 domain-containing protein [Sphingosinithalassobacter tenebrarum]QIG78503.1 DUF433 domain-containing protein [Sphingosinithalassobacter tenebrarum]
MNHEKRGGKAVNATSAVLRAFSVDHAARVTGLSKSRLTRWDKLGLFSPEHLDDEDRGNPYSRVYSFRDLVGLRTLKILTDKFGVPLRELQKAAAELEKRSDRPWEQIPLAVLKRKVVFDLYTAPRDADGQSVLKHIPLPAIVEEVTQEANNLRDRDVAKVGQIERRRYVAHNAYVIAGTRIPTSAIESFIEENYTDAEIVAEYPSITISDVAAVRNKMKAVA